MSNEMVKTITIKKDTFDVTTFDMSKVELNPHVSLQDVATIVTECVVAAFSDDKFNPLMRDGFIAKNAIKYFTNIEVEQVWSKGKLLDDILTCYDVVYGTNLINRLLKESYIFKRTIDYINERISYERQINLNDNMIARKLEVAQEMLMGIKEMAMSYMNLDENQDIIKELLDRFAPDVKMSDDMFNLDLGDDDDSGAGLFEVIDNADNN